MSGAAAGVGEALLRSLVGRMKAVFYPETKAVGSCQKPFYRELALLRQAATWPAQFIRANGTGEFPAERYEAVMCEILRKVQEHGPGRARMRCRAAYLLQAIQDHWRHNWEMLAPESKAAERAVAEQLRALKSQPAPELRAVPFLAQVNDALKTGRPKGRKPARPAKIQGVLF